MDAEILPEIAQRVSKGCPHCKDAPWGVSEAAASPVPCSLRRPAGAPWHLGSSSPPRRRPTGRLYSGGPDGIAHFRDTLPDRAHPSQSQKKSLFVSASSSSGRLASSS